jgi:hypothetical protein
MRKRARTVLCGGRSAMVVPTASSCRTGYRARFSIDIEGTPTWLQKFSFHRPWQLTSHLPLPLNSIVTPLNGR